MNIVFIGDVMPGRLVQRKKICDEKILSYLESSMLRVCNLEGVIVSNGPHKHDVIKQPLQYVCKHGIGVLEQASIFVDLDISVCNLANNHILDFGFESVKKTILFLNENNIKWFGFGKNYDIAWKPRLITVKYPLDDELFYHNISTENNISDTTQCEESISKKVLKDVSTKKEFKVKIAFFGLADHFVEWKSCHSSPGINYFDINNFTVHQDGNPNRSLWTNLDNIKEQIDKGMFYLLTHFVVSSSRRLLL